MNKGRPTSITGTYHTYKGSIFFGIGLFLLSIIVSIFLLFSFVIPQFQSWMTMNEEARQTRERIEIIKSNIQFVTSLNEEELDRDFLLSTSALPVGKDFAGAMQSILAASVTSGASLKTFNFVVGSVASKSAVKSETDKNTLEIDVEAEGEVTNIKDFIASLYTYLPLASISTADSGKGAGTSTKVAILFPSDPLPELTIKNDAPFTRPSKKSTDVLIKLNEWKERASLVQIEETGSTSADLPAPF